MTGWKALLKADPTDWLLEDDNPSVACITRVDLLGESEADPKVRKARKAIMTTGAVPRILSRMHEDGSFNAPGKHYLDKYRGSVWQLMILAEHRAAGDEARVRKACAHILDCAQDKESGGFSVSHSATNGGGRHSEVIPCLTGNMVWSLLRLGCNDARVQAGVSWIARYQRFDDGIARAPSGWPYDKWEMCWGKHTCHMAVVKALKALAEIPADARSNDVERTLTKGVEFLLAHHVFKKSRDLTKVSKPGWRRFQFPLMYQTDVLEVAGILTSLGCRDHRMNEAVDLIVKKQDAKGRWTLDNTFNGRFQVDIEAKGKPSKWVTVNALRVLKRYFGNGSR